MPRPLRIELEDGFYHVMNRGRGRAPIFHRPAYYQTFLDTLEEAHRRFGLEVHAYCLMGNHYHLLVRTPRGNLSRCMRHVNGVYTQRHNRLRRTDGPLFRGRFKAILVEADAYLLQLTRYVHRNPIEARRALVNELAAYPWSSYPAYLGQATAPEWLYQEFTYRLLNSRERYSGYRRYVEAGVDEETQAFYRRGRLSPVYGSDAFKARMLASGGWENASPERLRRQVYRPPELKNILSVVAAHHGLRQAELTEGGRGKRNQPRVVAMYLCQEVGGLSLQVIAKAFGVRSESGVSHQIGKLRRELADNPDLRNDLEMQIQYLTR
ncbi:helix-turn-helix domain-containing protein [Nitrococcus mobilis]|uniref:Putative orphan protein n=1 Tax=Nitrococcus mobilis Nb-231 TaxID=314278 RepID=A4BM89_9GAMM|nr:transposase [Nitrococcus mobilis]EAR23427.1 putative orphan protein [Nitrococcus mobilis Nb-231]